MIKSIINYKNPTTNKLKVSVTAVEKIRIEKSAVLKEKPPIEGIPFGKYFSDHMFLLDYDEGKGWHDPRVVPFADFQLSPAAVVLHYAQEIFEGMKAYRGPKGEVLLFRPTENARRLNSSAERICIPPVPEEIFMDGLKSLLELDKDWVPSAPDTSLYIRPFIIATSGQLGVHASHSYLFAIITSPVGSYYPEGLAPIRIMIENSDVRAVRGGTGYVKCGGNYGASIRAGKRAEEQGFSQVLWLDGVTRRNIEEVGSMNVMFKINGRIVTPALTGSVLPGITRKSCIELINSWGFEVDEREITVDELVKAAEDGTLEEAWGTGTAAVISPIGEVSFDGISHKISGGKIGSLTQRLYDTITDIQWGKTEDKFSWSVKVC
ncbi:MAG: branched-chain amino acid aminotransferase [Clostridia bacterium]|nr:branched-chain amino acid aminotransferase [Clostridia bacterium]